MAENTVHLLTQGAGYGVLVGVGAVFAGGMILTTFLLQKYLYENANSTETFSVANRSVGTFLSASAVYSSWSWATEFLLVTLMTYNYGIQAGFYFGAGLAVQIAVMSVLGIHAKKKIPTAHTSLEAVQLRYGKAAHLLYLVLSLICNICSCLFHNCWKSPYCCIYDVDSIWCLVVYCGWWVESNFPYRFYSHYNIAHCFVLYKYCCFNIRTSLWT